jgi:hypothetical protein
MAPAEHRLPKVILVRKSDWIIIIFVLGEMLPYLPGGLFGFGSYVMPGILKQIS